ncbi:MAG: tetratricopeptide repeat protein [Acidobacteriota bacterium]
MRLGRPTRISLVATVVALLAGPLLAAGSPKKEVPTNPAETWFNAGVELMKRGDWSGAVEKLGQAVTLKEDYAEAHSNLGFALRRQGARHYDNALAHYDRAIELDPELAEAYHYRGVLHALAGDEAAAKADHGALVDLDRELADELMEVIASGEEPGGRDGVVWK